MRNEINFTDEQIEAHFDEQHVMLACADQIGFTRDTLEDFRLARTNYVEKGTVSEETLGGFPALILEHVQTTRGQQRKDVVIIDYGTVRAFLMN